MIVAYEKVPVSRRQFITLIGVLACALLLPACATHDQPLKIGLQSWTGYAPANLASELGWLDRNLVTLIETKSATDSIKQLAEGKIDGAGLTLDELLRARENGIPLSVILVCDISAGADMLLARPRIKTINDLKGHRIGVEAGALGALMLYQILQSAGLRMEDVEPVQMTIDQHADAWKRNEIDVVITYEPAASRILEMEAHRIFDSGKLPDLVVDVLAVRSGLLDGTHENALRNLVASHLKALEYLNTNPEDASYRLAPRFRLPPEKVLSTFRGLVLPDLQNNIRLIGTSRPALMKSAGVISGAMLRAGILHRPADLSGLLRPDYLPKSS